MKRKIFFLLVWIVSISAKAQDNFSSGLLPGINVSIGLTDRFILSNKIESRQVILEKLSEDMSYKFVLMDVSSVLSFRTSANTRINGGYLIRIVDDRTLHRFIQQFNLVNNLDRMRLAHRFALDQTIGKDLPMEFRTRYRISLEKPLSGEKADPKEFYLKLSNEYLWVVQNKNSDVEIRFISLLGYTANTKNKIEAGFDYRFNEFLLSTSDHDLWINITWYVAL
ncbi:MAG: DUF2490 domain-containing protein [Bacteroidales bacterium]|nr:DUF2490 domain-containing protein [Bacteroidales bacterium]